VFPRCPSLSFDLPERLTEIYSECFTSPGDKPPRHGNPTPVRNLAVLSFFHARAIQRFMSIFLNAPVILSVNPDAHPPSIWVLARQVSPREIQGTHKYFAPWQASGFDVCELLACRPRTGPYNRALTQKTPCPIPLHRTLNGVPGDVGEANQISQGKLVISIGLSGT
jgi:hypothetical protein